MKMTKQEKNVISICHSKMLRNIYIMEMNKAKEKGQQELVAYYQREIDEIHNYFDACGIED